MPQGLNIACPHCDHPALLASWEPFQDVFCRHCFTNFKISPFSSLGSQDHEINTGQLLSDETEAACYNHSGKKAEIICDTCGRFLCLLCDLPFAGKHYCGDCLHRTKSEQNKEQLMSHRIRYDNIVLSLSILPIFTIWGPVLTAPATVFLAIYWWKKPKGILQRFRWKILLGAFIALLQISFGIFLIVEIWIKAF